MPSRVRLTAGRIRGFSTRPDQKQSFLWDTEVPWLAIRATKNAKVYVFQSRLNGLSLRTKIGSVDAWGIDQARTEARRLQTLIDNGIDPRRARTAEAEARRRADELRAQEAAAEIDAARRASVHMSEVWDAYIEERRTLWSRRYYNDHVNLARPGGQTKKRGIGLTSPGPLSPLMQLSLSELDADTVASWLRDESRSRPTQTRQAFIVLRAFLSWIEDNPEYRGITSSDIVTARRVRDALPAKRAKQDVLQREQLGPWFEAVGKLSNPIISAYLQTLLLTGGRREEIAQLTWTAVDFRWLSMTIADKVEGERVIPLTPYVADLLSALPQQTQWVFNSPHARVGHIVEPRIAHNRALAVAGLPPLSLHGLRRSFGSLSEWVEMPAGIVAQIMGHRPSATAERHYRRRPLDLLRIWHTRYENWLLQEAGITHASSPQAQLSEVRVGNASTKI